MNSLLVSKLYNTNQTFSHYKHKLDSREKHVLVVYYSLSRENKQLNYWNEAGYEVNYKKFIGFLKVTSMKDTWTLRIYFS